ncbi:mating-type switching protein swi1 [Paecilomyces variotii No. 5]|uniref:Topoisomerase 1-associated factor 1 n=1 Tax=Byssochlamys spectabilis (strain No. 5 / NBRC 109023) TaxID=1356009 RepID=V5G237_BYSSN|nr:mating-type switching protein swi1 [Paecilomyces variotii No. 5]
MDTEAVQVGQNVQVVDPEVRAYVYSLVTALGGFNGVDADKYVLGDDALSCLRDIKRWLKLYDTKSNRMDVARCLGEANLINGDLVPILSMWWESGQNGKHLTRIALACLELLVPLTWPVEPHSQMTVNHHRHMPYLQQVQVQYKRGLLNQSSTGILRAVIKLALPSMAIPRSERSTRDEGILKLMLYLFRNLATIAPNARLAAEGEEEETSRSATINAFQAQDVFALLLTMCSNMEDDFNTEDVILLEILFQLVRGVNVEKLFMDDAQRKAKRTDELGELLGKESNKKREYAKNAPTRHGRFGTMIWVKRDDAKVSTVSGQDTLKDGQTTLYKMDQSKKWNKPRQKRRRDDVNLNNDFDLPVYLNSQATRNLRTFVEEFLDSGFNPLLTHVRKAIEREADRVLHTHTSQFFYVVSWFLQAERARRARQKEQREKNKSTTREIEPDSFSLVAGVLNQETFVFLNRAMQFSMDHKEWHDLNASMRCFTQILLTVQEMTLSPLEEDQEIADNIQNRIFYEETTHDRILTIVRGFKDQGFGYLDACTELCHVFLRMLERYSKENVDMQVRSRRRAIRKKKAEQSANSAGAGGNDDENNEEVDSEAEELADAARVSKERKFDFNRFAAKFCNQKSVDTFVAFTKFYRELDHEQLKRAHRFFYRVAFKQDMSVLLFRVDIINLFYRMIKGPEGLDKSKPAFRDWEEFVKQLIRRLTKKMDQRPALIVEMLFSKINATLFYLEYGYERQTLSEKRAPAEMEVHPQAASTKEDQLAIVVSALMMDGRGDLVKWITDVLDSAANERDSWEAQDEARRAENPDASTAPNPMIRVKHSDEACRTAMFSNAKLRLLMTLAGFERLGVEDVPGASWVVPSSSTAKTLRDTKDTIEKSRSNPMQEINGEDPRHQLRRKVHRGTRDDSQGPMDVDFGADSEGEDILPDGPLFPPNLRTKSNALQELKQKRRKRHQSTEEHEPLDDETLEARRRTREANALARQAKIKSDLYIHASDEESDEDGGEEFFRLEEERRKAQAKRIRKALLTGIVEDPAQSTKTKKGGKRMSTDGELEASNAGRKRARSSLFGGGSDDGESDDDILMTVAEQSPSPPRAGSASNEAVDNETPLTSAEDEMDFDDDLAFSKERQSQVAAEDLSSAKEQDATVNGDDDDDEDAPIIAPSRRQMRGGFVVDSDSE